MALSHLLDTTPRCSPNSRSLPILSGPSENEGSREHLIGIDPDYRLHVSERLLGQNDGPMLNALKRLNGGTILCRAEQRIARTATGSHCASSGSRRWLEMHAFGRYSGIDYSAAETPSASLKALRVNLTGGAASPNG